jgi:L-lactate dehydrogenase complex protein LldF
MSSSFHEQIKSALADENLQAALDGNAERRIASRLAAFASLPDAESMRQRAHAVRAEVIEHLDRYLYRFLNQVEAHGIIVHQAADAAQAVQIILDIARQENLPRHGPRGGPVTVAKSKTMVSEEIHLNHALEQAGVRAVETDLGEYIVQLRGEPPSHIITPAVHLRRQQVGQLFHEKLGVPYTEEISEMTNTARRTLRQVFLGADIGLSGVNFGVVETGTLVLMTNEGNGRMVTTVPPVHIALMGMERLVPTMDDLALLMALLPRAATGQKLTVYASLIHGPRRVGEADGPQERHLVLVDNGRSTIRQTPLSEILYCIRCGSCLNACPVFREIGGYAYASKQGEYAIYPGPVGSVLAPALFSAPEFGHLARASSLCGACKEACPVDIDLPKLLLRVRAGMTSPVVPLSPNPFPLQGEGENNGNLGVSGNRVAANTQISGNFLDREAVSNAPRALKLGIRLFSLAAVHPRLFGLAQRLVGLGGKLAAPRSAWLRLPAFTGWGVNKDIPRPAVTPFHARWDRRPKNDAVAANAPRSPEPSFARAPLPLEEDRDITFPNTPLLERFTQELEALGGKVNLCLESELAGQILDLLIGKGFQAVMAWDGVHLPRGLLQVLQEGGIRVSHDPDPSIRAGITGVMAAVAETGTLVIPSGAGRPLTASLLPEVHIAVLRIAEIHESLSQVLGLQEVRQASAVVLVTGPSRTADIEMALTIGVHGPGEVHVFCVG